MIIYSHSRVLITNYLSKDLINAVISILDAPKEVTTVSQIYSNEKNTATEVQAYAKISGRDWTYYVKEVVIHIGRNTSPLDNSVQIDLGPAKVVSRKHATITFNTNLGIWELHVVGRNGAKVNFHRIASGTGSEAVPLSSGTILDIGGTQMMFILPEQGPFLDPTALTQLIPKLSEAYASTTINPLLQELIKGSQQKFAVKAFKMYNNFDTGSYASNDDSNFYDSNSGQQFHNQSILYNSNVIDPNFSVPHDLSTDLSRDDTRNIKPPHSYATMITQAILSTAEGELSLSDIYKYISTNYSFYRHTKSGWQNSIRHNLSLNKAFEKVPRKPGEPGKGMKWRISEDYQRDFIDKWNTGKIGKVRRGSSVLRQLQLHMSRFNSLPIQRNYQSPQEYQQTQRQPNNMHRSPSGSMVPSGLLNTRQQNIPLSPPTNASVTVPLRQHHQSNLPPPIQTQSQSGPFNTHVNTSINGNNILHHSPTNSLQLPSAPSHISSNNDSLLHSPSKSLHISAVEAYTPERGSSTAQRSPQLSTNLPPPMASTTTNTSMLNSNTISYHQPLNSNSPGVWNLLQFSVNNTPGGSLNSHSSHGKFVALTHNVHNENRSDGILQIKSNAIDDNNLTHQQVKSSENNANHETHMHSPDNEKTTKNVKSRSSSVCMVSSPIKNTSNLNLSDSKLILDTEAAKVSIVKDNLV